MMSLKQMAEFKRNDYSFTSVDGDEWEVTIVQTSDRKYVEIKKDDEKMSWDVEMLLDIADAIRSVIQKPVAQTSSPVATTLKKPTITDHRPKEETPSDMIQASVDNAMESMNDMVRPVESFSPPRTLAGDIAARRGSPLFVNPTSKIKKI